MSICSKKVLQLCLISTWLILGCSDESEPPLPLQTDGAIVDVDDGIPPTGQLDQGVDQVTRRDGGGQETCTPAVEENCVDAEFLPCSSIQGTNQAVLIRGTVILTNRLLCSGDVLFDAPSREILCVGESCSTHEMAAEATVVCADIVLPGLIDAHNHMSYNTLPPWRTGGRLFENRGQWNRLINEDLYDARPNRNDPVAARYSELRLLLSGTTSVHKAEDTRSSHAHVRNLDRADDAHGLGYGDRAFKECVFPSRCDGQPNYETNEDVPERAFVAHVAEGIDAVSQAEFDEFDERNRLGPKTAIIHCVACTAEQLSTMKTKDTKLIWSPQSNMALYGQTTDVPTALNMRLTVALGPDWTPSGTMNMLTEAKCAQHVSKTYWNNAISDAELVKMMTVNAARSLGVADKIGALEVGMLADILALSGNRRQPYSAVIEANPNDVRAVFIDGQFQYGDPDVHHPNIARNEFCEAISLCDSPKMICVKDEFGEPNRFDKDDWPRFGFYDIENYVASVVRDKMPESLSEDLQYAYVPHPLFECVPTYDCDIGNALVSGQQTAVDTDGDGHANDVDNCPQTFNTNQSDLDNDSVGDACDSCPWAFPDCPCTVPSGPDSDGDGVTDDQDNCRGLANADQSDRDGDQIGDACDLCPDQAVTSEQACSVSISRIKDGSVPVDEVVETEGTVTGVYGAHLDSNAVGSFFIQTGDAPAVYDGLFVYMGNRSDSVTIPTVGARLQVTGTVGDFFGQRQLSEVSKIEAIAPTAIAPTDEVLSRLDGREAERESELICLYDLTVSNIAPEPGPGDSEPTNEFEVQDEDGAFAIRVNDVLYPYTELPNVGTYFQKICGVYHLANGNYKIEPRGEGDLVSSPSQILRELPKEAVRDPR